MLFLDRARRVFAGKTAVVDADGTEVSYAELGRDCDALAGALRAGGVRPGDRVAMLDLNSRWLLAAHYGVPGSGAVLVALNTRLAAAEYREILAHSRARVLLLSAGLLRALGVTSADQLPVETGGAAARDAAGRGAARRGAVSVRGWPAATAAGMRVRPATRTA